MMLGHLSSCFLIQCHCSPGVFSLLFLSAFQCFKLCDFLSVYFVNEMHLSKAARRNGEGNGTPLQYSCLENPMDRGAW